MAKDFTKYQFNGQIYSKGRLVLAVVTEWVKKNSPTVQQIFDTFPNHLQGNRGVLINKQAYETGRVNTRDKYERFFVKEEDILNIGGTEILTCSQWGQGNITGFIEHSKNLGFEIVPTKSEIENQDIIQEFIQYKKFTDNYKNWSLEALDNFCTVMKEAHENGLDIFTTNMINGGSIRIGRKDITHKVAVEVLATFEPNNAGVFIAYKPQANEQTIRVSLTFSVVEQIINSGILSSLNNKFPISRRANWPSDYPDTENDTNKENKNIWKVSHSPKTLSPSEIEWLSNNKLLAVHQNTGNGSVPHFKNIAVGDIVSLGYGNQVAKLVRVDSNIQIFPDSLLGKEWLFRKYEIIKSLDKPINYNGEHKRWSPRYNGTCWIVPTKEHLMFQQQILEPYYDLTLDELDIYVNQASDASTSVLNTHQAPPLNQILFGPPGTGKTYRTVQQAVNAAEPGFIVNGTSKRESRKSYKIKFDELASEKRIRFVTFHQSYGYEEFVEGLSAKTEGNQLSYYEKDGIFKTICEDAKAHTGECKTLQETAFDEMWKRFSDAFAEEPSGIQVKTLSDKTYFTITDISDSTIRFDKAQGTSIHTLSVKTLKSIYNNEKTLNGGLQPYYGALVKHLKISYDKPHSTTKNEPKNFVLIIDEINRGNISKIFGELITLIEPSKRLGKPESLAVTLPYSGDSFSVPDNLYIIGTMNTADRSLALMDTALRRRFDFIEMMPDYDALRDDTGNSYLIEYDEAEIDLVKLLETLNNRITALYDREHTLGHAFFMPVVNEIILGNHEQAITELSMTFKNKIIPLLEEYFFEDWKKIRLVIADNQKEATGFEPLIKATKVEFENLFGSFSEDDSYTSDENFSYVLASEDSDIWLETLTYVGMYDAMQLTGQ